MTFPQQVGTMHVIMLGKQINKHAIMIKNYYSLVGISQVN